MRQIDADAMYQRFCVDRSGLDGIYDANDLPDMLAEMPTIAAIPVEWIQQFCEDDISEEQRETIKWMLGIWQEEQEERRETD